MPRKPFILSVIEAVAREAPLLLQVENECSDFVLADPSHICAYSL